MPDDIGPVMPICPDCGTPLVWWPRPDIEQRPGSMWYCPECDEDFEVTVCHVQG